MARMCVWMVPSAWGYDNPSLGSQPRRRLVIASGASRGDKCPACGKCCSSCTRNKIRDFGAMLWQRHTVMTTRNNLCWQFKVFQEGTKVGTVEESPFVGAVLCRVQPDASYVGWMPEAHRRHVGPGLTNAGRRRSTTGFELTCL